MNNARECRTGRRQFKRAQRRSWTVLTRTKGAPRRRYWRVALLDKGRALKRARDHGCLRIYVGPDNGRILGAEMCAPGREHLAHLLAWAIQQQLTVFDIVELPFYHPTVEEALRTAVRDAAGKYGLTHKLPELALCDRLPVEGLD